jgi:hypothetical protein
MPSLACCIQQCIPTVNGTVAHYGNNSYKPTICLVLEIDEKTIARLMRATAINQPFVEEEYCKMLVTLQHMSVE